jgi:hypothetical protein
MELANIWTTLFGLFPDLRGVISPDLVNEPRNVMIVCLGDQFSDLEVALEPTVSARKKITRGLFHAN